MQQICNNKAIHTKIVKDMRKRHPRMRMPQNLVNFPPPTPSQTSTNARPVAARDTIRFVGR